MSHVPAGEPVRSDYASDPDMLELVELFVAEMPLKVQRFGELWDSSDTGEIERAAHQLKGSSAGYGFGVVGEAAGRLESRLKDKVVDDLESIRAEFDELVDLCSRVTM